MAYRITPNDIRAILNFDPSIEDLTPFIAAAEELVTELCAPAGYDATRLPIIEVWLAAHFVAIRDPRYQEEHIGAAGVSYQAQVGLNLGLTPYGQQAMLLDTKGGLAWIDKHISQGKRAKAGITYLGTDFKRFYAYPWRFTQLLGSY